MRNFCDNCLGRINKSFMTPSVVIRDVRVQRADVHLRFLAVPAIPFAVEMEETLSVGLTVFLFVG